MRQIIIGREGNQPFVITDGYVSRIHAIFSYEETTGVMTLTSKSKQGTYVRMGNNFQRIEQCFVDATTVVRLGPYFTFSIGQLFQAAAKPKQQSVQRQPQKEKVDIAYLRKVAENYEGTKLKLEQKQANINSLRTLSLVGSIAGGGITTILPKMFGTDDMVYYLIGPVIAVIFMVSLMIYCSKANKDVIVMKSKNEKNYKIAYCCPNPKCHASLAGRLYENILAEGKCPKCKTEYYDSKT